MNSFSTRGLGAFLSITAGYAAAYFIVGNNLDHKKLVTEALTTHLISTGLKYLG